MLRPSLNVCFAPKFIGVINFPMGERGRIAPGFGFGPTARMADGHDPEKTERFRDLENALSSGSTSSRTETQTVPRFMLAAASIICWTALAMLA